MLNNYNKDKGHNLCAFTETNQGLKDVDQTLSVPQQLTPLVEK